MKTSVKILLYSGLATIGVCVLNYVGIIKSPVSRPEATLSEVPEREDRALEIKAKLEKMVKTRVFPEGVMDEIHAALADLLPQPGLRPVVRYDVAYVLFGTATKREDKEKAALYARASIQGGFAPAYSLLAQILMSLNPEDKEVLFLVKKGCELNDPTSLRMMGGFHLNDDFSVGFSPEKAEQYFLQAADLGDPESWYYLALAYRGKNRVSGWIRLVITACPEPCSSEEPFCTKKAGRRMDWCSFALPQSVRIRRQRLGFLNMVTFDMRPA